MDTEKLVKTYVNLRDAKDALTRKYKEEEAALKEKLQLIEGVMLKTLQDAHADSIKTPAGIFYKQEEVTPTGSDWDAFYSWVADHNAFEFLERRIKKTAIKEYMETHDGSIPPGVSVFREYAVRVRRA